MRPLLHTLAGLAVAAVAGALPARAEPDRYDQVERGRYLAIVGDCTACHAVGRMSDRNSQRSSTPGGA